MKKSFCKKNIRLRPLRPSRQGGPKMRKSEKSRSRRYFGRFSVIFSVKIHFSGEQTYHLVKFSKIVNKNRFSARKSLILAQNCPGIEGFHVLGLITESKSTVKADLRVTGCNCRYIAST